MADRYWVGGTGTWNSTNTANWAASSGGASGATVPTASDNVFFNVNSNVGTGAFTVTMADTPRVCNDFTASGLDGTMTLAGASIALTVSGSLTFQAGSFTRTYTGVTTFNATTTGKTVTTNGIAFGAAVTFDGVGGGWTLGSAFSCGTATLTVTNGTFSTSGSNYAITCGTFSSNNSNIRTINLNASTVTLSGAWTFTTSTNLTFTAGTSQINLTGTTATFSGGGLTYRNVATTSSALVSSTISGANTFNNLTIGGRSSAGISQLTISSDDQTINGTFTVGASTTEVTRTKIICNPFGTTRTLTCAAVSFTHVDFQDITIAGAASPASGTGLGNAGNNSGITFPAAKTVYYRQTGSSSWGVAGAGSWSLTSGGAANATAFPLAQDTAVFPAATYPASGSTTTINAAYFISTIDMSLRTSNTMTLASSTTNFPVIGNWINGTGITLSGTGIIGFEGSGSQTITNAGRTFTQSINIRSPSGSVTLQDPLTLGSTRTFTLTNGTLDLQSYTLSTGLFSSTNSNTRTIAFGTGNIECTGTGTVWNTSTVTGLTTTGTQVVNVTSTGSTSITVNYGGLNETNAISFNFTGGTYALTLFNNVTYARNINFTGFAGTVGAVGISCRIYGNLTLSIGMTLTASSNDLSFEATSGTETITTNAKTIDFPLTFNGVGGTFQLQDALTMGSTRTATLNNGTLDLQSFTLSTGLFDSSNSNTRTIAFGTGQINCTGTGTVYTTGLPTNLTCTGSKTVNITSVGSTAISVDSSAPSGSSSYQNINFTGGTYALTLSTFAVNNVNFTGFNGSYTPTSNIAIRGNLTLSAGMTYGAATTTMQFVGDGTTQQITSNGKTINENVNLQSTGGTLQPQDALTISSTKTFTLTYGTLDIQSYTLSTGLFSSDNSYARTIAFGTGQISITGTGTAWDTATVTNLTVSGSKTVNFINVGSTTIQANMGALSEADALDVNVTGGTYAFRLGYSNDDTVRNLNFTGYSGQWTGLVGSTTVYGNLIMPATMTIAANGELIFASTSGTKTITTNGVSFAAADLIFNGAGGTWQLQDNVSMTGSIGITFTNGTLDLNGKTVTSIRGKTGVGTKNITFNGGTLVLTDSSITTWFNQNPTGFTTTAGTGSGKISMTGATAKTFGGNGATYNCTLEQAGAGTLSISGSNTFLDITNTVQPTTITFNSSQTQTFINGFSLSGTAGNLVTINQNSSTQAILSKASGTVSVSFCSISYSNATGGATWEALTLNGNVNGGNNNGWLFGAGGAGNMFLMF